MELQQVLGVGSQQGPGAGLQQVLEGAELDAGQGELQRAPQGPGIQLGMREGEEGVQGPGGTEGAEGAWKLQRAELHALVGQQSDCLAPLLAALTSWRVLLMDLRRWGQNHFDSVESCLYTRGAE